MYTKEHSPLGSQFSCPECGSGSFTFFIPYKLKPIFFMWAGLCGLVFILENSDSVSNLSSLL